MKLATELVVSIWKILILKTGSIFHKISFEHMLKNTTYSEFCVSFWMILVFPSLVVPPKHPKMISFSRKTHHEALIPIYTPENLRREPKTHLIEKETHLPSTSIILCSMLICQGVLQVTHFPIHPSLRMFRSLQAGQMSYPVGFHAPVRK